MTKNEVFLQAICENPDDDTVRLVCADWLDENGDPEQAAFIRKQCELARVPEYDPLWVQCWHHDRQWISGLKSRQELPTLPGKGLTWATWHYRRGFLWRLKVLDFPTFLDHAAELFSLAPIQALDVDARSFPDLGPLASSPWLGRLTTLAFSLGRFAEEPIRQLIDSPNAERLTDLTFQFAGIGGDGLRYLLHAARSCQIRHLDLRSNDFSEFGRQLAEAFQGVQALPSLESLALFDNRIGHPHTLRSIINGPSMPRLTKLDLCSNPLGTDGVRAVAEAANLAGLTILNLSKTNPGVAGARALFQSAHIVNLYALHLAANRLGPVTVHALAACPQFNKLRTLNLSNNPLGDNGAKALARSQCLNNLISLDLRNTEIEDQGATALIDSPTCANLIHLDLSDNHLSESVRQALKNRFGDRVSSWVTEYMRQS